MRPRIKIEVSNAPRTTQSARGCSGGHRSTQTAGVAPKGAKPHQVFDDERLRAGQAVTSILHLVCVLSAMQRSNEGRERVG
jgi:hypothetical protein